MMMDKKITSRKFLEDDINQFYDYPKIKKSLEIIEAEEMEEYMKKHSYKKRRGVYLFGKAGTGKTTLAIKKFLKEPYYQKSMTTSTYDNYHYEKSIFFDEMNPKNSRHHLD